MTGVLEISMLINSFLWCAALIIFLYALGASILTFVFGWLVVWTLVLGFFSAAQITFSLFV